MSLVKRIGCLLLFAALTDGALAQSPTLQRLEQLEYQERQSQAAEAAQWRTFPEKPSRSESDLHGYNPLAATDPSACQYHWSGWRLDALTGIRRTAMRCSQSLHHEVAVQCSSLKMSTTFNPPRQPPLPRWSSWRLPATRGEREMMVALCDNLTREGKKPVGTPKTEALSTP